MTEKHLEEVDSLVKSWIRERITVHRELNPLKQAIAAGDVVYMDNVVGFHWCEF